MKNRLTEQYIRDLKPSGKQEKHFDGGRLYLFLSPKGARHWRMGYHFDGKDKTMCFGSWPDISLDDARAMAARAKKQLACGIDPRNFKEAEKIAGLSYPVGPGLYGEFSHQLDKVLPFLQEWAPYVDYLKNWAERLDARQEGDALHKVELDRIDAKGKSELLTRSKAI